MWVNYIFLCFRENVHNQLYLYELPWKLKVNRATNYETIICENCSLNYNALWKKKLIKELLTLLIVHIKYFQADEQWVRLLNDILLINRLNTKEKMDLLSDFLVTSACLLSFA